MTLKVLSLEEFRKWEEKHRFYIYKLVYIAVNNDFIVKSNNHYDRVEEILSFILNDIRLSYNILLSNKAKKYLFDKLLYDISLESYER